MSALETPAAAAEMISCSRGYGRLLPSACARRSLIADGRYVPDGQDRASIKAAVQHSKCVGCPDGQARAAAGAHKAGQLVRLGMAPPSERTCFRTGCGARFVPKVRHALFCSAQCRDLARAAAEGKRAQARDEFEVPPAPAPRVEQQEEPMASKSYDKRECAQCGKAFTPTGARQKYCNDPCDKETAKQLRASAPRRTRPRPGKGGGVPRRLHLTSAITSFGSAS